MMIVNDSLNLKLHGSKSNYFYRGIEDRLTPFIIMVSMSGHEDKGTFEVS